MKIKVHWIVDGIAELDADSQQEAEKWVNQTLSKIPTNKSLAHNIKYIVCFKK